MSVQSTVNSPSIGCRLPRLVLVSKTLGAGPRRNHTLNRDVPCKDGASYRRPLHRSPFIETLGFYSAPLLLLPLATQSPDRDDRYVFHGRCAQRSPISQFDSVAFAEHTISLRLNGRVVHEHVSLPFVASDKAIALRVSLSPPSRSLPFCTMRLAGVRTADARTKEEPGAVWLCPSCHSPALPCPRASFASRVPLPRYANGNSTLPCSIDPRLASRFHKEKG